MKAAFFSICFTFLVTSAFAQVDRPGDLKPTFIAVAVSNLDKSIKWYEETLGLKTANRTESKQYGYRQANLKSSVLHLELVEIDGSIPQKEVVEKHKLAKQVQGITKFGFKVADIDAWNKYFESLHVTFAGRVVKDFDTGKRMFLITDPDENLIQLFEE